MQRLLYNFLRVEDRKKNLRALLIVSESKDESRTTQKYLKINRWVGTLQNKNIMELSEYIPFTQIMDQHAKLFELQNSGVYLKTPWSILFSDDLQLGVDCENDFHMNDGNLSDSDFYNAWQPKALEDILEEMIADVGQELCSVRTGSISCILINLLFLIRQ